MKHTLLPVVLLLSLAGEAMADRVYISDVLYVPLRGGQSQEHRIIHRGLKSGTPLERLEINEDTGYSRVRTEGGTEGWVLSQYLADEPIAADTLAEITARYEALEAEHQKNLLSLRAESEKISAFEETNASLNTEKESLSAELDELKSLSANVIAIEQENRELTEVRDQLNEEISSFASRIDELEDQRFQQWFMTGAGTVLVGLLFGFWVGRRIYQRRNTGGWA